MPQPTAFDWWVPDDRITPAEYHGIARDVREEMRQRERELRPPSGPEQPEPPRRPAR